MPMPLKLSVPSIVPALLTVPAAPATTIPSLPPEISDAVPVLATLPPLSNSTPIVAVPVPSIVPALVTVPAAFLM
jgi:hypothetical protein